MNVLVCCTGVQIQPWLEGLRAALPEDFKVQAWAPGAPLADAAVVWAPPQAFFDEQTRLRTVYNIGAGVDAILGLRLPADLQVVRLDDAGMSVQMAEYVCHATIRCFREFDVYEAEARAGRWAFRKPLRRSDFVVGIMGLGVLGQRVAQALRGFDFPVRGWSLSPKQLSGVQCFAGPEGLADFLSATRVLVCLLPLTPQTAGIIGAATIGQLPAGAHVINVARGAHVVDEDLLAALDAGHLAGATLDVFRTEPLPADHPFWRHPRVTVTPHTSARTLRDESIAQIAAKMLAQARGEAIRGVVDRRRGY